MPWVRGLLWDPMSSRANSRHAAWLVGRSKRRPYLGRRAARHARRSHAFRDGTIRFVETWRRGFAFSRRLRRAASSSLRYGWSGPEHDLNAKRSLVAPLALVDINAESEDSLRVARRTSSMLRPLPGDRHRILFAAGLCLLVAVFPGAAGAAIGERDPSFGTGGRVTTHFGASDSANAIALQANGMLIVAGGAAVPAPSEFALARYAQNGGARRDLRWGRQGHDLLWWF